MWCGNLCIIDALALQLIIVQLIGISIGIFTELKNIEIIYIYMYNYCFELILIDGRAVNKENDVTGKQLVRFISK